MCLFVIILKHKKAIHREKKAKNSFCLELQKPENLIISRHSKTIQT